MTTVYVVTSGCYSDYGIAAIFSTEERANIYLTESEIEDGYGGGSVEEYQLNEPFEFIVQYKISMEKDGDVSWIKRYKVSNPDNMAGYTNILHNGMWAYVEVDDEQHAIKIANERRTRIIAEDNWHDGYRATF